LGHSFDKDQFLMLHKVDQKKGVNGYVQLYPLNIPLPNQDTRQSLLALRSDIDIVRNSPNGFPYCSSDLASDEKMVHLQLID